MFFVFSKLFSAFIDPSVWLVVIVVIAAFLKTGKWKKRITILAAVLFLFFSNQVILNKIVNAWQPAPVTLNKEYSAGIALGGFSSFDKKGTGYMNGASDRFISTANLYHSGIIKKIIVSGGDGSLQQENPKESGFARTKFIENRVKDTDVFAEENSRNTFENAYYSKKMLDSLHLQPPYVLITSALHMRRAKAVFEKAGLDVVAYPCAYEAINVKFSFLDYIIPNIDTLFQWKGFLKEFVGLCMYKIVGKV